MDKLTKHILNTVAGIDDTSALGAFNIRVDGVSAARKSTGNVVITPKDGVSGIEIHVKPGVKNETCHIPVVIKTGGINEKVYNDFYIGDNAEITIVAGCGIHNDGEHVTGHDGIHTFHLGKNAFVRYIEKHYAEGTGRGRRVLNPETVYILGEGSVLEAETIQIGGVDFTRRTTKAVLDKDAKLKIREKLLTSGTQAAITEFTVDLNGPGSGADVISRSVARDGSKQEFYSSIRGNSACVGHSECDAIIMDGASVKAMPEILCNNVDASLVHEAAIGKIAGEQIVKLMSLGLTESEAVQEIINGFLK
jgi:Fe-S cluster assembly scaffold protein SufB